MCVFFLWILFCSSTICCLIFKSANLIGLQTDSYVPCSNPRNPIEKLHHCQIHPHALFRSIPHSRWLGFIGTASRLLPHVYGGTFGSRAVVSTLPVVRRDDGTFLSISGVHATPCDAVVWDCDGTLINTEPLWKRAESHVFGSIGMPYTEADGKHTTGLRIDAVVDHWATTRG